MRRLLISLIALCFLLLSGMLVQAQETPPEVPLFPPDAAILSDMYARINAFRERRGLTPYRLNESLNLAAQNQAEYLVRTGNRGHFRMGASSPSIRAATYGFVSSHWCCGENYYMSIDATPDMVFDFWRWSPNHFVNLAHRDFTDIGLGMSSDGYRISYVTLFGEADDLHPPEAVEPQTVLAEQAAVSAPAEASTTSSDPAAAAPIGEYVVVVGDTLGNIAARHHTTVQALMTANHLANSEIIYVGQRLIIGGAAPAEAVSDPSTETSPEVAAAASDVPPARTHVVTAGENLAQIAARYGVSLGSIVTANQIADPSIIYEGQVLAIPGG